MLIGREDEIVDETQSGEIPFLEFLRKNFPI